jgi:hypothetical protein
MKDKYIEIVTAWKTYKIVAKTIENAIQMVRYINPNTEIISVHVRDEVFIAKNT